MATNKLVLAGVLGITFAAISAIAVVPDFASSVQSIADMAGPLAIQHENQAVPPEYHDADRATLRLPFAICVLLIVVVLASATYLYRKSFLTLRDAPPPVPPAANDLIDQLHRELVQTGNAIRRIGRQAHGGLPQRLNFNTIECEFTISAAGDTTVTQNYWVKSKDEPGLFWYFYIDDVPQHHIALQDALAIRARSLTPGTELELVSLERLNAKKQLMIWFLPEIAPNTDRRFGIDYTIPQWFKNLYDDTRAADVWTWSHRSRDPDDPADVKFIFRFDTRLGAIQAKLVHPRIAGESLTTEILANGLTVFTYVVSGAPVGRVDWELHFSRSRP